MSLFRREYTVEHLKKRENIRRLVNIVLYSHPDYQKENIQNAIDALKEIKKPKIIKMLAKSIKDKKWGTRIRAAESLGRIGDLNGLELIIQAIKDESSHKFDVWKGGVWFGKGSPIHEAMKEVRIVQYGVALSYFGKSATETIRRVMASNSPYANVVNACKVALDLLQKQ